MPTADPTHGFLEAPLGASFSFQETPRRQEVLGRVGRGSGLEHDQGADARERRSQRLLETDAQRRRLRRTRRTRALHHDTYGSIRIDPEDLDVAAVGHQGRSKPVDHGFDGITGRGGHGDFAFVTHAEYIGSPEGGVERKAGGAGLQGGC